MASVFTPLIFIGAEMDQSGAKLTWDHLRHANMSEAELQGKVVDGAELHEADINDANLLGARGLN